MIEERAEQIARQCRTLWGPCGLSLLRFAAFGGLFSHFVVFRSRRGGKRSGEQQPPESRVHKRLCHLVADNGSSRGPSSGLSAKPWPSNALPWPPRTNIATAPTVTLRERGFVQVPMGTPSEIQQELPTMKLGSDAALCLQETAEEFTSALFAESNVLAAYAGRAWLPFPRAWFRIARALRRRACCGGTDAQVVHPEVAVQRQDMRLALPSAADRSPALRVRGATQVVTWVFTQTPSTGLFA